MMRISNWHVLRKSNNYHFCYYYILYGKEGLRRLTDRFVLVVDRDHL